MDLAGIAVDGERAAAAIGLGVAVRAGRPARRRDRRAGGARRGADVSSLQKVKASLRETPRLPTLDDAVGARARAPAVELRAGLLLAPG